jgi:hypothetical protein
MSKNQIPNIFIKEIDLFDSSNIEIGIKITTMTNDIKGKNSWSNQQTSKFMKALMVVSSNPELNFNIANGQLKFDKDFLKTNYGSDKRVKIFSKPIRSPQKIEEGENIKFLDSYEVKFEKTEQEIKVFCQVYFETSEMLQEINLSSSRAKRKYGPVISESIIENQRPARTSTVFLLPNGQQYVGPVHFHPDKGYMVGAEHTSEPHEVLRTLSVVNFKIKDFRTKDYTFSKSKHKEKTILMSKLNYSINNKGHVTGIFSINFKNLILNETKYGYFLKSLSNDAILQNINNVKIKNLQITRKRIDVDETSVIIKSFSPFAGAPVTEVKERFASISELMLNEYNIRMFQFTDKTINKTSLGAYEYHLSISFKDPTVDFISNIIQDLRTTEKEIDDYYTMVNKNKNYDFKMDLVKPRMYESEFNKINPSDYGSPIWSKANEVYVRTISYLYDLSFVDKTDLTFSNATKLDPRNSTIFSIRSFKEDLTKLVKQFDNNFELANENIQFDSEKTFVKTANSRNIVFINHGFKESVELKNYSISYNYLNLNSKDGALILQKEQLIKRLDIENNKFFNRSPSAEEAGSVPYQSQGLFNLQENYFSFLSPLVLSTKELGVSLSNIDEIQVKNVNKLFNRTFGDNIYKNKKSKKVINTNVSETMSEPNIAGNLTEDFQEFSNIIEETVTNIDNEASAVSADREVEDYLSSAEYLGSNSLFVNYEKREDENEVFDTKTTQIPEEVAEVYDTPPNINEATPSDYSLSFVGNILALANQSLEEKDIQKFLLSLPNQIRALFLYSYPFVKKMRGYPNIGIISNLKTQASVNINYYKLVRIEIFDGYEMSSDGEVLLNGPKYKPLTGKNLGSLTKRTMCRLKRYYNNDLKLKRDILSFPIENEHFFIEPPQAELPQIEELTKEIRNITIQHIVSRNYDSAGSTSNIVIQSKGTGYTKPNDGSGGITALPTTSPTSTITSGGY